MDTNCADNGVFAIENLNNLDVLLKKSKNRDFIIHTYPVNYEGLSGLP
ncbi:Putative cyclase (fragment) [uncultured Sporomusa sp.]|uniref:Putative cyclase n=1 Tax=uncultured Sporomusa sp. TaxID=307249 RepID=A0A212LNK2_9FIRM